jgi:hypothetical protein
LGFPTFSRSWVSSGPKKLTLPLWAIVSEDCRRTPPFHQSQTETANGKWEITQRRNPDQTANGFNDRTTFVWDVAERERVVHVDAGPGDLREYDEKFPVVDWESL